MKFHGSLEELKLVLNRHDILGSWEAEPNGVHMMRCADGANLHWASGGKTVWIDGRPAARPALVTDVAAVLHMLEDVE